MISTIKRILATFQPYGEYFHPTDTYVDILPRVRISTALYLSLVVSPGLMELIVPVGQSDHEHYQRIK